MQVQDVVVGNKNFTDLTKPSEIVQLLLNEDQLANLNSGNVDPPQSLSGQPVTNGSTPVSRELRNEEGDDSFAGAASNVPGNAGGATLDVIEDEAGPGNGAKKKRKPGNVKIRTNIVRALIVRTLIVRAPIVRAPIVRALSAVLTNMYLIRTACIQYK